MNVSGERHEAFRLLIINTLDHCTPLDPRLRLLLDCVRVDAAKLWTEADLLNRVEAARACGMAVIAENARYRDGEKLADVGIELARAPKVDA